MKQIDSSHTVLCDYRSAYQQEALRMRFTTAVVHDVKFIWLVGLLIKIIGELIAECWCRIPFSPSFQARVHFGSIGQESRHHCNLM